MDRGCVFGLVSNIFWQRHETESLSLLKPRAMVGVLAFHRQEHQPQQTSPLSIKGELIGDSNENFFDGEENFAVGAANARSDGRGSI